MGGSPLRYNLEDLRITNLDKFRLLFAIVTLAYIVTILTAFDERKKQLVKKKCYKNGTAYDAVSVFKQGQLILKQQFVIFRQLLEIIQYLKTEITLPIPHW